MDKINQGYPGDLLSKRRQKFLKDIEREKNRQTGYTCMRMGLVMLILLLLLACWIWSQGHFFFM